MKIISLLFLQLIFAIGVLTAQNPKYIFLFIGDGMGYSHIALTEAAIAAANGEKGFVPLNFTKFPATGFVTTHSQNRLTTCSAAAGTALASGEKTSINTIGMNVDRTRNLPSIGQKAKDKGLKVGIITSVSIDHATPAAFYAHEPNRNMYYEIASWISRASFDLYASSGLVQPIREQNIYDQITLSGYQITKGVVEKLEGSKVYWEQKEGANPANIPLAIDAKEEDLKLQDMTKKAIDFLYNPKGFFVMIEGGQIDWAGHANDAAAIVHETKNFADAIEVAIDFYKKHPNETLIVVTADHETGGLALGLAGRGYDTDYSMLYQQKVSKGVLETVIEQTNSWDEAKCSLKNNLGFWGATEVSSQEEQELLNAYNDKRRNAAKVGINILQSKAGVGFTSTSHTAIFVPVFAIGVGSELFNARMDNTDIPKKIQSLIN